MGVVVDKSGNKCEEVKWHTRQKHYFLEEYLKIWTDMVGKKGKYPPSLDIFDLFASHGWCYCDDAEHFIEDNSSWPGTAVLSAKCLESYKKGRLLFLNTYNPKESELADQVESLNHNLSSFNINKMITTLPIEEAVDEAIKHVNKNFPSLWVLDPYAPSALPWNIVEKVCTIEGSYINKKTGSTVKRKPELLINLMTYGLQINFKNSPETITKTLGMPESEWKAKKASFEASGGNATDFLIETYKQKISLHYEKEPIIIKVKGVGGNIVYALFLVTDANAGNYVMSIHQMPEYKKWFECNWEQNAKGITAKKKLPKEQSSFSDFF